LSVKKSIVRTAIPIAGLKKDFTLNFSSIVEKTPAIRMPNIISN